MDVNIKANGQAKCFVTVLSICKKSIFIWATFKVHDTVNDTGVPVYNCCSIMSTLQHLTDCQQCFHCSISVIKGIMEIKNVAFIKCLWLHTLLT